MTKTAFFGTSDKSIPILENLHEKTDLKLCITKSDRLVGRKQELKETLVKTWAKGMGVPYFEINKFDTETKSKLAEALAEYDIELGVVADFSFIVPTEIISTPKFGLINIHFSALPKYRGASPIQHTILAGETKTAISFIVMTAGMDEGDIIEQIPYELKGNETTETLYTELFKIAGERVSDVVKMYVSGTAEIKPQNSEDATYCYSKLHPKSTLIYKEDAKLDWTQDSSAIERTIRAYNPWPIAWTTLGEIEKAGLFAGRKLRNQKDVHARVKIFAAKVTEGRIMPTLLQTEGGKKLELGEWLNGFFE